MMQLIEIPSSKRSSSEARLLLREYSHRINNEFASAIGANFRCSGALRR